MGSLSIGHWLIVLVIVLLVFGPARLGQVGKGLGEGIKSFKKGLSDDEPAPPKQLSESKDASRDA
jgi:sec-independent protein translocase protein TatA